MKIKDFIKKHIELKKTFENIDCSQLDSKNRIEVEKAIELLDRIIKIIIFSCKNCDNLEEDLSDDLYKKIESDYREANVSRFFF